MCDAGTRWRIAAKHSGGAAVWALVFPDLVVALADVFPADRPLA